MRCCKRCKGESLRRYSPRCVRISHSKFFSAPNGRAGALLAWRGCDVWGKDSPRKGGVLGLLRAALGGNGQRRCGRYCSWASMSSSSHHLGYDGATGMGQITELPIKLTVTALLHHNAI
eukprot:gene14940-biopygen17141